MTEVNIKYSKITKEVLEEYYKENSIITEVTGKENKKVFIKETAARYIYQIACIIAYFTAIYHLETPASNLISGLPFIQATDTAFGKALREIFITLVLFAVGSYTYFNITNKIRKKIFPLNNTFNTGKFIKGKIKNSYYEILEFQETMKKATVNKITTDGYSTITIEYIESNGITTAKTLNITENYSDTIKSECIDFRWVDREINNFLQKLGYREIQLD